MSRRTFFALALSVAAASLHGVVALTLSSKIVFQVSVATAQRVFGSSVAEKQIFDDVDIYRRYSGLAVAGGVPYRDFAVEYPILAFPLFLIPRLFASRRDHYRRFFAVEMLIFDAMIVFLVFRRVRDAEGLRSALKRVMWYSLSLAFLWILPISRYDLAPTALAFAGAMCWNSGRGLFGGVAAGIGALMKIFPGLIALPPLISGEARGRGWLGFAATLASGFALWFGLGGSGVATSLGYHLDRGLEIGSVPSNGLILWSLASGSRLSTAFRHTCSELDSPGASNVASWSTAVLGVVLVFVLIRFRYAGMRDNLRSSGVTILAFVVCSKVLSPQYVLWILPFVAVLEGRTGRRARPLFLAICVLTSLAYPWSYMGLIKFHPLAVAILTVRNVTLLVLLALLLFDKPNESGGTPEMGVPARPTPADTTIPGVPPEESLDDRAKSTHVREFVPRLQQSVIPEPAVLDFEDEVVRRDEAAVVGDDDEGGVALGLQAAEDAVDLVAGAGIELAGGLVGEEQDRVLHEGAGDGDSLLFAAGKLVGAVVEAVAEADGGEQLDGLDLHLGGDAAGEERDEDVLDRGEVADEVEGLEDEADLVAAIGILLGFGHRREVAALDDDLAGGGAVEGAEEVEERTLARSRRADDEGATAAIDPAREAAEGLDLAVAVPEGLADVGHFDHRLVTPRCDI